MEWTDSYTCNVRQRTLYRLRRPHCVGEQTSSIDRSHHHSTTTIVATPETAIPCPRGLPQIVQTWPLHTTTCRTNCCSFSASLSVIFEFLSFPLLALFPVLSVLLLFFAFCCGYLRFRWRAIYLLVFNAR